MITFRIWSCRKLTPNGCYMVDADLLLDKPGLNTERATVFGEAGNRMNRGCLLWPDVVQRSPQLNDTQEVQFF